MDCEAEPLTHAVSMAEEEVEMEKRSEPTRHTGLRVDNPKLKTLDFNDDGDDWGAAVQRRCIPIQLRRHGNPSWENCSTNVTSV